MSPEEIFESHKFELASTTGKMKCCTICNIKCFDDTLRYYETDKTDEFIYLRAIPAISCQEYIMRKALE